MASLIVFCAAVAGLGFLGWKHKHRHVHHFSFGGLSPKEARVKLIEIWNQAHPDADFEEIHPNIWPWMETWYRLRSTNSTLESQALAFEEALKKRGQLAHRLSEIIHTQRLELQKRLAEIDKLKAALNPGSGASR